MIPFLRTLAEALLKEHGTALRDVAVVLPSQRAGLYLRKHLADANGGALWSPELLTFPSFMERISGLRAVDQLQALFELHGVLCSIQGDQAEAFGEFLQWAPTTLRDMSEVDAHLVELNIFYRDLRALEEVEEWSLRLGDLSTGQRRLVKYWELKRDLHRGLNERLHGKGLGTSGAIERGAAEKMRSADPELPWSMVWVAGANAMTTAETTVVEQLLARGRARLAWDADHYYLDDAEQEAGRYLRTSIQKMGAGAIPASNDLLERERRMSSIQVPNAVAQVYQAAQLVADLDKDVRSRTVIVLADETLLMPLLRALPGDIGPVNVTMGLPLSTLPVSGLFDAFFHLHASVHGDRGLHMADLSALLLHAFLHRTGEPYYGELISHLRSLQRIFLSVAEVVELAASWPEALRDRTIDLLRPIQDVRDELPRRLADLISMAREAMAGDAFAEEQLYRSALVQQRMLALSRDHAGDLDMRTYAQLQHRLTRMERIGFFGEPLGGLQIMGMLETRAVDHERMIVLSAMEGALPPSETGRSFIPFDVRRAFGLPLPAETEAIAAYSLHRAIQRAEDVMLLHHGADDATEPSRYIAQLERGLEKRARTIWSKRSIGVEHGARNAAPLVLQKTEAVLSALRQRLQLGLSPTSITDHVNCPMDFWYRHVLGLKAGPITGERLGADKIGSAVHAVLQAIYAPFIDRPIDPQAIRRSPTELAEHLHAKLQRSMPGNTVTEGQPLLQLEMAAHALSRYLDHDAERLQKGDSAFIIGLEHELTVELAVEHPDGAIRIPLSGTIDRIERRQGLPCILDYKTGGIRNARLELKDLELSSIDHRHRYALQLMIYGWSYLTQHPALPALCAQIVPLQTLSLAETSMLELLGEATISRARLPAIEALLTAMILDILDPSKPIAHRSGSEHCLFCAA